MAHDCKGEWTSKRTWTRQNETDIRPENQRKEPDGKLVIEGHTTTSIKGKHHADGKQHDIESGECHPNGPGRFKIKFKRNHSDPNEYLEYSGNGVVTSNGGGNITGTIVVKSKGKGGPKPQTNGDTATWEANRPGSGILNGKDKDRDKDKE